jgi:hypothetical protein
VAALYREKLELLGIQIVACVYTIAANGTFPNNAKTDMDALRERILFKFVLEPPESCHRNKALEHEGLRHELTRVVRGKIPLKFSVCVCSRALSVGSERVTELAI